MDSLDEFSKIFEENMSRHVTAILQKYKQMKYINSRKILTRITGVCNSYKIRTYKFLTTDNFISYENSLIRRAFVTCYVLCFSYWTLMWRCYLFLKSVLLYLKFYHSHFVSVMHERVWEINREKEREMDRYIFDRAR